MRGEKYTDLVNPCKKHPDSQRYANSGGCVQCRKDRNAATPRDYRKDCARATRAKQRAMYPDKFLSKADRALIRVDSLKSWHEQQIDLLRGRISITADNARTAHTEQLTKLNEIEEILK